MACSNQKNGFVGKWLLLPPLFLLFCQPALPLGVQPTASYSIINAQDELLPNPDETTNKHEMPEVSRRGFAATAGDIPQTASRPIPIMGDLPEVIRRGFAGDDFYQKASKSIPRMGRRSGTEATNCVCKPFAEYEGEILENETADEDFPQADAATKMKRLGLVQKEMSVWPWFTDRVPNTIFKRTELSERCYYIPKVQNYFSSHEIGNEDLICCPASTESPVLKRYVSTYSNKQTTTSAPDYKSNRFM